jgi:pyruvate-formate lyase
MCRRQLRVATIYPIFFTALSPDAQDDIIARTEHSL